MGVSTHFRTYFGIRLEWDEAFHDAYEAVYNHLQFDVLVDGMSGEYIVLGHKLYDSGDERWGWERGTGDTSHTLAQLAEFERTYKAKFIAQFPDFAHLMERPFEVVSLAHYS